MPTNQPGNAPDALPKDAGDIDTMTEVLTDEDIDDAPGGGGLGGQAAAEPSRSVPAGATRSTPITPPVVADDAPDRVADEAERRALDPEATAEPRPSSL